MDWSVEFDAAFYAEFRALSEPVREAIAARVKLLEHAGPQLSRPYADTLKDSNYKNMKELRCDAAGGVWRIAFAFDQKRQAILLVAGDKRGADQEKFYKTLIATADQRFSAHLERQKGKKK